MGSLGHFELPKETDPKLIQMKLKMCQFKLFNNYLINVSKKISSSTNQVELLLVKNNLTVTISLNNFLQLMHGVSSVVQKENLKN